MSDTNPESSSTFNTLNTDVTESILSLLPTTSLVRFSSVSKQWHSIITSLPSSSSSSPWLFLFGIHNTSSIHNQSFAFDPLSNTWLHLPSSSTFPSLHLVGSNRFLFTTAPKFSYSPILKPHWRFTSPLRFPRINPLLAVSTTNNLIILVGGVGSTGGLVDIDDRLPVQIYYPTHDTWQLCPPLPPDFRTNALSSALCRNKFYVFDINSCFISYFCLDTLTWSHVQTLRPPGLSFAFLNVCDCDTLVLGGITCDSGRGFSFNLWRIQEGSMEFSEIAIMPEDLLFGLVDNDNDNEDEEEDCNKYRSLKCVGSGNLVYVFNEDCHKKYPACVCEIGVENGRCSWRRVPRLPYPVNKFHKLVSFCSSVSISDVFHSEETVLGS